MMEEYILSLTNCQHFRNMSAHTDTAPRTDRRSIVVESRTRRSTHPLRDGCDKSTDTGSAGVWPI